MLLCTVNSIYLLLFCLFCVMYHVSQKMCFGGNTLISVRKNGMLLPVDLTETVTSSG